MRFISELGSGVPPATISLHSVQRALNVLHRATRLSSANPTLRAKWITAGLGIATR